MNLIDVPKEKKNFLDGTVKTDVCSFGIYPDMPEIEEAGKGLSPIHIFPPLDPHFQVLNARQ